MWCEAIPAGLSRAEGEMVVTTLTSREFDQDASGAKELARRGPVFITDHGRPAYVLLTIESYQPLTCGSMSPAEARAQTADAHFEFKPPRTGRIFMPPAL